VAGRAGKSSHLIPSHPRLTLTKPSPNLVTSQLSLSSDPALLKIARDTVRMSDCWNEGNAPPEVYPAAVRVGYNTEFFCEHTSNPNLLFACDF
jgi:hypothetical protein